MTVRRVVTGHSTEGKSIFVSDQWIEPLTANLHRLWATDELPTFPSDGVEPFERGLTTGFLPAGAGGIRFWLFTLPPAGAEEAAPRERPSPEVRAQLAGLAELMDPSEPGMHTTDTIDLDIVLSGQITLELDDGAEVTVGPGDVIIQNGTRHRWCNSGTEPAVVAAVMVGAHREQQETSGGPDES